ncbi:MAG: hypothetical protein KIS81_11965 [Maricaulaceae bacterium]|nr:hypothetical protein [Maricaulaceae bacterium]
MTLLRTLALSAALAAVPAAGALAQTAAPQFQVQAAADGLIRAGVQAFERGQYDRSASFSQQAINRGLNNSRRAIAYNNLCAALGAAGDLDGARAACESSLAASVSAQAHANLGAVLTLAGDAAGAQQHLAAASQTD